ncbi:unnamed protein product [Phaeothamnion confervicola]
MRRYRTFVTPASEPRRQQQEIELFSTFSTTRNGVVTRRDFAEAALICGLGCGGCYDQRRRGAAGDQGEGHGTGACATRSPQRGGAPVAANEIDCRLLCRRLRARHR